MTNYAKHFHVAPGSSPKLRSVPYVWDGREVDRKEAKASLKAYKSALDKLQVQLYAERKHALLLVFQGMDASGKDGVIKHVITGLNPQGVAVTSFKQPTPLELSHDFLWRIHQHAPPRGGVAVFNRSHYEDVLVTRVHKNISKSVWTKRYEQINSFEQLLAADAQTTILKFFLHISKDHQLRRFKKRLTQADKRWKISTADYSERELWDDYEKAYEDVLAQTSTKVAPWYIIPANQHWFRNLAVAQIIAQTLGDLGLKSPEPTVDLEAVRRDFHAEELKASRS